MEQLSKDNAKIKEEVEEEKVKLEKQKVENKTINNDI